MRITVFNRNMPILVEMRGLADAGDKAFAKYANFLLFKPFQPVFS